jgi:hypothetical protein
VQRRSPATTHTNPAAEGLAAPSRLDGPDPFNLAAYAPDAAQAPGIDTVEGGAAYGPVFFSPILETNSQLPAGTFIDYQHWHSEFQNLQPITPRESAFRHSGWAPRRIQTWQALCTCNANSRRLNAFANCGSGLWLEKAKAGNDLRLRCNCCHDRFCIPCGTARATRMVAALKAHVAGRTIRHLTVTLKHSNTPLPDQINRLLRSFAELRRRRLWTNNVVGGAAFMELKISSRDGLWHVHLHCLIEGTYLPQKPLVDAWHAITGDSTYLWIKPVPDSAGLSTYVCKYVTKPADASVFDHADKLVELMQAMKGTRLCTTFGTWRGYKLTEDPGDKGEWESVGSLWSLAASARDGEESGLRWITATLRKYPRLAGLLGLPEPPPVQP